MSAMDEVAAARASISGPGGPPADWRPLQWVAALQVNTGKAAMAAMVLDGARTEELDADDAPMMWRRSLASIAAVCIDALEVDP
jgi:hypothetical protein